MKAITKKPIHRMENLTDWGTAGAFTFTLDTDKKEGEYAFKIVNAAGAFNIYYRYDPVLDIDIKRYMRLWVKSPTSATFWLVLRTDAANFSTWINIATTPEYTEISIDLDNPDSTNGDGFDKTKLWSLEFFNPDPGTWYFDYANYETDVESKISECMIYSPTPQKPYTLCTMVIHPDNESYFVEGETIIIKDDSDVICFAGKIVEKDEKRTHYKLTALGWDHEFRGAMYKNSYTAKKTSQILEGQIDSSAYTYYDSSIDDTTITYTYKVAKRNNYMIMLARWMERGVFYQVMEESEYKAYFDKEITDVNILPDSGETWVLGTTDGINHVGKKNLDIGLTRVHVWGTVNSDGQVNYIASSSAPEQEEGITPTYPFTDPALTNYTEVKQLADNLLAIFGTSQLFIELVVEGKGFLQPWYRVSYANASLSMAADDYAIAEWIYDAKGDIYTKFIITNGIAYESEFRTIQKQMTMRDDVINAEFIDVSVPVSTMDGTVLPLYSIGELRARQFLDEDDMASDDDNATATQQSIKAFAEALAAAKVSDAGYGVGWSGVTTIAPSKNTVFDTIQSIRCHIGTYTGNGANNRTITVSELVGNTPKFIILDRYEWDAHMLYFKTDYYTQWLTSYMLDNSDADNSLDFIANGFVVNNNEGSDMHNRNGIVYYYILFM